MLVGNGAAGGLCDFNRPCYCRLSLSAVRHQMRSDDDRYADGDDGLIVEKVGAWASEKQKLLTDYIHASGAARRKFSGNDPAYIDPFCGPGRSLIRTTRRFIDGSPIAAFENAKGSLAPFARIEISDADVDLLHAAESRLRRRGAPVRATPGPALAALERIVPSLNQYGLHFAFLDPHNLGSLSFDLFDKLAKLRRVDVLVHVSVSDLQRNVDFYSSEECKQFDEFAPGWRAAVGTNMNKTALRTEIIRYWTTKVEAVGLPPAGHCELISGPGGQRLYWLMLLGHELAHELWEKISSAAKAPRFDFGGS